MSILRVAAHPVSGTVNVGADADAYCILRGRDSCGESSLSASAATIACPTAAAGSACHWIGSDLAALASADDVVVLDEALEDLILEATDAVAVVKLGQPAGSRRSRRPTPWSF